MANYQTLRQKSWSYALCSLPNNLLASGGEDTIIRILKYETLDEVATLKGHYTSIFSLCYVGNGILASGASDEIIIWDTNTGKLLRSLETSNEVYSLCLLDNGSIAASMVHEVIIWNINTTYPPEKINMPCVKISEKSMKQLRRLCCYVICSLPDEQLATGLDNGDIIIWDLKTMMSIMTLAGGPSPIVSLCTLPDGLMASGNKSGDIIIWDLYTMKLHKQMNCSFNRWKMPLFDIEKLFGNRKH